MRPVIPMMLDQEQPPEGEGAGFAFTFELPAVPREGEYVYWAGRVFKVARVEWLPFVEPYSVRLLAYEIPQEPLVHILRFGFALCHFSPDLPRNWPNGQRWVEINDLSIATCATCKRIAKKMKNEEEASG